MHTPKTFPLTRPGAENQGCLIGFTEPFHLHLHLRESQSNPGSMRYTFALSVDVPADESPTGDDVKGCVPVMPELRLEMN